MKKISLFILLVLFISTVIYAEEWISVSPFTDENRKVIGDFISPEEGWAFQLGIYFPQAIYHTYDGAQTWELIYSLEDPLEFFTSIEMIDSLHGWATKTWMNDHYPYNQIDYYLRTSDGGLTWEDMTDYIPGIQLLYARFYFYNADIGFTTILDTITSRYIIHKTIDGGYNWYETGTPIVYDSGGYEMFYDVTKFFFLNEQLGWASCAAFEEGLSLFTEDCGETWERGIDFDVPELWDIHFVDSNHGGTIGYSLFPLVLITEDNFESISYQHICGSHAIFFQNDSTIWVTGMNGHICRSTDSGATFEIFQTVDVSYLYKIQFFGNTGYIFGTDNSLLKFVDPTSAYVNPNIPNPDKISASVYPNPLKNSIYIEYSLPVNDKVEIAIYNIKGRSVYNQILGIQKAGTHTWTATPEILSSGIYLLQIKGCISTITKKLVIIK